MTKYYYIFAILFLTSCGNNHSYTLQSDDKKQNITIISQGDIRYIINGDHDKIPDTNYLKVDVSKTEMRGYDEMVGCWQSIDYEWFIINDEVIILENKLDTERFKFGTTFPEDEDGIPTIIDFNKPTCFDIGFAYNEILNIRGDITVK